jgi:hypothetical protein
LWFEGESGLAEVTLVAGELDHELLRIVSITRSTFPRSIGRPGSLCGVNPLQVWRYRNVTGCPRQSDKRPIQSGSHCEQRAKAQCG